MISSKLAVSRALYFSLTISRLNCVALQAGGAAIQGGQLQLPDPEIIGDLAHFAAAQLLYPFEYIGKRIHIEPHFICIPGFPQGINTYFI